MNHGAENINIGDWIRKWALIQPDKTAVIFDASEISYRQLNENVNRLTNGLQKLGIKKGDRVGVVLYNSPIFIEIYFTLAKIGAILVPINWRLSRREVEYILNDSGTTGLIFEKEFTETIASLRLKIPVGEKSYVCVGEDVPSWATEYDKLIENESTAEPMVQVPAGGEDPHIIMYTSGTTGVPKGAILSHRKTFFNVLNANVYYDLSRKDIFLMPRVIFHSGGLLVSLSPTMYRGATVILKKRFRPVEILETIEKYRVTIFEAPATLYKFMMEQCEIAKYDLSSLRICYTGGERVPLSILDEYANKGITITQLYGQTETSTITWLPAEFAKRKRGSVGVPVFHGDIRIAKKDGSDAGIGEIGEILVSGEISMTGYWGHPELTDGIIKDGWLYTGDLATVDEDGYLHMVDRKKDMFISGGENVYPAEVEKVLLENPKISDVACIGVPDEKWGETGMAFIIPREDKNLFADEIQEFCSDKLAKYKIPKYISLVDELPRNAAGKIMRYKLRELFLEGESC